MKFKRILYKEIILESQSKQSLQNKCIVVIGAGSGIGKSVAINADRAGAKVVLAGRNYDKLCALNETIIKAKADVIECDVSKKMDIERLFKRTKNLDVVINCAGVRMESDKNSNPLIVTNDEWDDVFETNLLGNILLVEKYNEILDLEGKKGKYIAISSVDGTKSACTPYGISKSCLNEFIRDIAKSTHHCKFYSLAPGPTATRMMNENMKFRYYRKDHPDRRCALPQDIANLAMYLSSDNCNIKSGSLIKCDGGFSL